MTEQTIPTLTKFDRLLLALALQEIGDRHYGGIRGFADHVTRLAAKLDIDEGLAMRAREWIETSRRLAPYSDERARAWEEAWAAAAADKGASI